MISRGGQSFRTGRVDVRSAGWYNVSTVESLTTKEATQRADLNNVQQFHRLAARHGIFPTFEAPGKRGAKFWNPRDVDRLRDLRRQTTTEAVA